MRFQRFVYGTRGLYLLAAQVAILWLKHSTGGRVSSPVYFSLLVLLIAAQLFRTWAAGFVGTAGRERETRAEALLTAGPYAYVRNPMYLGGLVVTTALAAMSGLWYAAPIAWGAYLFVYANVIPFEEAFLRQRFGDEYLAYLRAVPRLLPTLRPYSERQGKFRLREALANEAAAWTGTLLMAGLFYVL
ncbi:MAG: isoprenylcysteine carboxylmethyltransferase family protein [Chloroflexi bacterium]|nr:isoprenylcysteine carboxylmethyltransferase family protein [Chloroflexota bacterium]